jgi:hypothetical protein
MLGAGDDWVPVPDIGIDTVEFEASLVTVRFPE